MPFNLTKTLPQYPKHRQAQVLNAGPGNAGMGMVTVASVAHLRVQVVPAHTTLKAHRHTAVALDLAVKAKADAYTVMAR